MQGILYTNGKNRTTVGPVKIWLVYQNIKRFSVSKNGLDFSRHSFFRFLPFFYVYEWFPVFLFHSCMLKISNLPFLFLSLSSSYISLSFTFSSLSLSSFYLWLPFKCVLCECVCACVCVCVCVCLSKVSVHSFFSVVAHLVYVQRNGTATNWQIRFFSIVSFHRLAINFARSIEKHQCSWRYFTTTNYKEKKLNILSDQNFLIDGLIVHYWLCTVTENKTVKYNRSWKVRNILFLTLFASMIFFSYLCKSLVALGLQSRIEFWRIAFMPTITRLGRKKNPFFIPLHFPVESEEPESHLERD